MIVGDYPCCDGDFVFWPSDDFQLPVYRPEDCPHCGARVWHLISYVEPMSWTESDFLELFEVCEETRVVKRRIGT